MFVKMAESKKKSKKKKVYLHLLIPNGKKIKYTNYANNWMLYQRFKFAQKIKLFSPFLFFFKSKYIIQEVNSRLLLACFEKYKLLAFLWAPLQLRATRIEKSAWPPSLKSVFEQFFFAFLIIYFWFFFHEYFYKTYGRSSSASLKHDKWLYATAEFFLM